MTIGANGFVKSCVQTYADDNSVDTWTFGYTSEGNLNYMKRSEGGNEITTVKYKDGDITEVTMKSDEDGEEMEVHIFYTSDDVQTAIENKGCLMFFDTTFSIDVDEMAFAYWAGLLGKATKHLPVKNVDVLDDYTDTFHWSLKNGYPESMTYQSVSYTEEYQFSW